jgi:C-terminal processing protease CtpA/Prc
MKKILLITMCTMWISASVTYAQENILTHKYTVNQIHKDFIILKQALTYGHPSLYWYTTKDTIEQAFQLVENKLTKEMTEVEFRKTIQPAIEKIKCGHTDVLSSKAFQKYRKKHPAHDFPLNIYWDATKQKLFVLKNESQDSTIKKGYEIVSIEQYSSQDIINAIEKVICTDGYNQTYKTFVANNYFSSYYRYTFGEKESYLVKLRTLNGEMKEYNIKGKDKKKSTLKKDNTAPRDTLKKEKSKILVGNKNINLKLWEKDSTIAILDQNTFRERKYKRYYKQIFEEVNKRNIKKLVIDVRANGGGKANSSALLASYLLDTAFVMHTESDGMPFSQKFNKYTSWKFLRKGFLFFATKKKENGHLIMKPALAINKPQTKNHYNGKVFVLANGGSFSAASIFTAVVQEHKRVVVIGRETGGGRYGCTAWVIPNIILPETKVMVRLPMFRVKNAVSGINNGRGVMPDYPVIYTWENIEKEEDLDMLKVKELCK